MQEELVIETSGRALLNITEDINRIVRLGPATGLCSVFVHHTSASLLINEAADPDVVGDIERWFSRLVVDGDRIFRHRDEGPDDMSAHIRSVLTATSLTIPVTHGRLNLGTWQGVFLWEHRAAAHHRRLTISCW